MGLVHTVRIAGFAGLGGGVIGASYYWLAHLSQVKELSEVPLGSLLAQDEGPHGHKIFYRDCFETKVTTPMREDVTLRDALTTLGKSFLTCPLFRIERAILSRALPVLGNHLSDEAIVALPLEKGDAIAAWTVVARTNDEILMEWDVRGMGGSTWLAITKSRSSPESSTQEWHLYFGSSLCGFNNQKSLEDSTFFPIAMNLHKLYSRALLDSVAATFPRCMRDWK